MTVGANAPNSRGGALFMTDSLKKLFEPYREAVVAVRGGKIAFYNGAAARLFGDISGATPEDVFPAELLEYGAKSFSGAVTVGNKLHTASVVDYEGCRVFTVFPIESGGAEGSAVLLSAVNTKMREYLSVVKMSSGLLGTRLEDCGDPKLNRLVAMIEHNCACIERAVKSVDLFSEGRSDGDGDVAMDLAEVFGDLVDSTSKLVSGRGVKFSFRSEPDTAPVCADRTKLERLLLNLLSNSIKHTPEGGSIEVSLSRDGERTVLTVRDTGSGIPEDVMYSVWNRYLACREGAGSPEAGLGLGLSLVQQIAREYGGSAVLESAPGKGTTVAVVMRLPRPKGDTLREVGSAYARGMQLLLTELSDVLDYESYGEKYMD